MNFRGTGCYMEAHVFRWFRGSRRGLPVVSKVSHRKINSLHLRGSYEGWPKELACQEQSQITRVVLTQLVLALSSALEKFPSFYIKLHICHSLGWSSSLKEESFYLENKCIFKEAEGHRVDLCVCLFCWRWGSHCHSLKVSHSIYSG